MGGDRIDAHSVGRGGDRLTIAEAATLLGVHKNTVRNRIKNGSCRAEMVQTERGPTYLIERESLLTNLNTNTLSRASQELVSSPAMECTRIVKAICERVGRRPGRTRRRTCTPSDGRGAGCIPRGGAGGLQRDARISQYGRGGAGEGRASLRYGRGSGGRTEAIGEGELEAQTDRRITARCMNSASICLKSCARQSRH
jgi:excisionase family DNA binding protein